MGIRGITKAQNRKYLRKKQVTHNPCFVLLVLILCSVVSRNSIYAQNQLSTSHSYTYGQSATFNLSIEDGSAYRDYTLYIRALDMNVLSYSVQPTHNQLVVERNLREQPLPPFSLVTYWWEYTDVDETLISTEKTTFRYIDNRFSWQTYTDKSINLYWVSGDKTTLMSTTNIAWDTLEKVQHALQTPVIPNVDIYFYPSTLDLQSALQLAGYDWVSGAAYPELGVLLLTVTDGNQALSQIQRNLPHELTHKILFDMYGAEGYANIPSWLDEGLASYFEPTPDPAYAVALNNANASSSLLRFESLCHPFPDNQPITLLSYAQSDSITRYIQSKWGWSSIRNLLQLYAEDGIDCTTGLEVVLEVPSLEFEREWRVWLETQSQTEQNPDALPENIFQLTPELRAGISIFINDAARWLVLCAFLVLPFLAFGLQFLLKKNPTK